MPGPQDQSQLSGSEFQLWHAHRPCLDPLDEFFEDADI